MRKIMMEYELFKCGFCDDVLEESEQASCETIDVSICVGCHRFECGNTNLCEMAGNF